MLYIYVCIYRCWTSELTSCAHEMNTRVERVELFCDQLFEHRKKCTSDIIKQTIIEK